MKKKLLLMGLSLLAVLGLSSCGESKSSEGGSQKEDGEVVDELKDVKFLSKEFVYDGNTHELSVENLPSGFRVEYTDNGASVIGNHLVKATIYKNDKVVKKLGAELTIDCADNKEFNDYLDDLFLDVMGNNFANWNQMIADPASVGYKRPDGYAPNLGQYATTTQEDIDASKNYALEIKASVDKFKDYQLSINQLENYEFLKEFSTQELLDCETVKYEEFYDLSYVNSFGGVVSTAVSTIQDLDFLHEYDITDIISYITSFTTDLPTFLDYLNDGIELNLALADDTIDDMIEYLTDVYSQKENYYLYEFLQNKVDACEFLSNDKKVSYKTQIVEALNNHFMPSLENFATKLKDYKGHGTKAKSIYELNEIKGDALKWYENNLKMQLGNYESTVDDYAKEMNNFILDQSDKINEVVEGVRALNKTGMESFQKYMNGKSYIGKSDPAEIMEFLKQFAKTMVVDLKSNPEISFQYLDEAYAKTTNVVAYYSLSALDKDVREFVTLNGEKLASDANELLTTLAHEGYPGHLYHHVYCKEKGNMKYFSMLFRNLTFGEGWATYVENKLLDYLGTIDNNAGKRLYAQYAKYLDNIGYALNAYVDYLVNYKGQSVKKVEEFLDDLGFSKEAAEGLYESSVQFPLNYEPYAYGRYEFLMIHEIAKHSLGDLYDEAAFNAEILGHGSVTMPRLTKITNDYVSKVLVLNGQF